MIITCPNCSSEYDVLETALGEEGREVKCAKCNQKWFCRPTSMPDSISEGVSEEAELEKMPATEDTEAEQPLEKILADITETEEETADETVKEETSPEEVDIPDAVKPLMDGEEGIPVISPAQSLPSKMAGYAVALLLFGALIVSGFIYKNEIIKAWPPSSLLYEMAGTPVTFKGEGLVVESLSATILKNKEQQEILIVKGRVVNLTGHSIDVPRMEAKMRSATGGNIDKWLIDPPVESIEAGESFAFTSDYPNVPNGVGSVNLAFIPTLQ